MAVNDSEHPSVMVQILVLSEGSDSKTTDAGVIGHSPWEYWNSGKDLGSLVNPEKNEVATWWMKLMTQ